MVRRSSLVLVRILLSAHLVLGGATVAVAAAGVPIDGMVAEHATRAALEVAFKLDPVRCQPVPGVGGAITELCEWRFSGRDAAWEELAEALATDDRVGVICGFELAGGARIEGSCTAHVRRSDRNSMRPAGFRKDNRRRKIEKERRAARRAAARAQIDAALTFDALTRAVGEVARSCKALGDEIVCEWNANSRTPGHGTVLATIDGNLMKQGVLTCRLPADGSDRADGSCTARIGR